MTTQKTKGNTVKVFQKHTSREDLEGIAELVKRMPSTRDTEHVQNWKVMFVSDGFVCERLINVEDLKYDVPHGMRF